MNPTKNEGAHEDLCEGCGVLDCDVAFATDGLCLDCYECEAEWNAFQAEDY